MELTGCLGVVAIQGVGSGAIPVLVAIVTADLIPLKERGTFQALTNAYVFTRIIFYALSNLCVATARSP